MLIICAELGFDLNFNIMSFSIFNKNGLHVDYYQANLGVQANVIVFTFTPFKNTDLEGLGFGGEFILEAGFDLCCFKTSNDDWYQSVPICLLEEIATKFSSYEKKIAYGSSMGGFASCVFSEILELNSVIVLSPQYTINEEFDVRWKQFSVGIDFKYIPQSISQFNKTKYHIFFDDKDLDLYHVKRYVELLGDRSVLYPISYAGHPVGHFLSEIKYLKSIVIDIISDNFVFDKAKILESKKFSMNYHKNLILSLIRRRHSMYANRLLNQAKLLFDNSIFTDIEKKHANRLMSHKGIEND